ncbi:peptidoglycan-binding domain-containing protein [Sorangium sp. So ce1335]|uniref:peptidoglycan-binding domain-containing protein n=1 Tax=Sorangium sp. So ce1335 TaxID=3133335 RepID=UPI003F5E40DA
MTIHVVRQGEYLDQLAHKHGFDAEEVWNDERNVEIRERRPDPSMLAPGDHLCIPATARPGTPVEARAVNRYRARVPMVEIAIALGSGGVALAHEPYVIEGLPGGAQAGQTDDRGQVRFRAPITTQEVTLELVNRGVVHPVRIGHLDPVNEDSGVRQRLRHLGYFGRWIGRGEPPLSHERDARAIRAFQRDHGLEVTGYADRSTRERLVDVHGS